MTTIETQESRTVAGQSTDIDRPAPQLSSYDLAGWLRRVFRK